MRKVVDGHLHLFRKATADYPRTTYDGMAEATARVMRQARGRSGSDHGCRRLAGFVPVARVEIPTIWPFVRMAAPCLTGAMKGSI